jgi:UDP-N-acetyl-D-mannosaminuronate dehydrogenase
MRIGIIGLNKVGLTFGFLCQEAGFDVFGSDINQKLVYEL